MLALYDKALRHVYGYLLSRCRNQSLAQDLTAETFLAAVAAVATEHRSTSPPLSRPWLIGVARHKLADHWRRQERESRGLRLVHAVAPVHEDSWDVEIDVLHARTVLDELGPHHRAALTLRYFDGLPVPQVAEHLGRGVHATEALLSRARAAFRTIYLRGEDRDD